MAILRDMTNSFWNYISPRKTQQRRDKEFKVPAIPARIKKDVGEPSMRQISPDTLVKEWAAMAPKPSLDLKVDELERAEIPPSPPFSLERPYTDDEGDTLVDDLQEHLKQNPDDEDWDANEETIVVDDIKYMDEHKEVDPELERERREAQGKELRDAGWTEDAIFLFQKLGMRGFEPLLPYNWIDDFKMLPLDLFTRNLDKAFVKPVSPEHEYHASRALDELLGVGGRVRDAVTQKAPVRKAERHIRDAVRKYNKWAMNDSNLTNVVDNLSIFDSIYCRNRMDVTLMEARMHRRLDKLAARWRDAFREREIQDNSNAKSAVRDVNAGPELPTLYGVISSHTVMALVSYDVNAETPTLRMVASFDWGQEGYDVWNSLAIAIFVIHCRNRMTELQEFLPQPESGANDSDPDA